MSTANELPRPAPKAVPEPAAAQPTAPPRARAGGARLLRSLPTLLVFAALAGVAAWGHSTGWKLPGFGGSPAAGKEDWCDEHGVPESACVECNPALLPAARDYGWCDEHGVPECPEHHPDLAQTKGRRQLPRYDTRAALALLSRPENDPNCTLHRHRVQLASEEAVKKAGIGVEIVKERPLAEYVSAYGEIIFDPTRVARLSSPVPGRVWKVFKQPGEPVRAGEVLALVDAAEVGKAKAELLQGAIQVRLRTITAERLRKLARIGAESEQQLQQAENALGEAQVRVTAARELLANLGLPIDPADLDDVPQERLAERVRYLGLPEDLFPSWEGPKPATANLLPLKAPLGGVVVTRDAVAGETVDPARPLLVVADPRRLWLILHARQEDAKLVRPGQAVRVRVDGDGVEATGQVDWVSPAADHKTRTVPVRVVLDNADGRLRDRTFATGRVVLREEPNAVTVPREALHWDGSCHVVFVRDRNYFAEGAAKVFHVRKVRPGARDERFVELLAGVLPGEVVAAKGSGALRAQLLKADLGEG